MPGCSAFCAEIFCYCTGISVYYVRIVGCCKFLHAWQMHFSIAECGLATGPWSSGEVVLLFRRHFAKRYSASYMFGTRKTTSFRVHVLEQQKHTHHLCGLISPVEFSLPPTSHNHSLENCVWRVATIKGAPHEGPLTSSACNAGRVSSQHSGSPGASYLQGGSYVHYQMRASSASASNRGSVWWSVGGTHIHANRFFQRRLRPIRHQVGSHPRLGTSVD